MMFKPLIAIPFAFAASQHTFANDQPSCASLRFNPPAGFERQISNINKLVNYLVVDDVFSYLQGGDSVFGITYEPLKSTAFVTPNKKINPYVSELVGQYDSLDNPKLIDEYLKHIDNIQKSKSDFTSENWENKEKYPSLHEYVLSRTRCEVKDALENSDSKVISEALAVVKEARQKVTSADVGKFQATINHCEVKEAVGTGNKFAEPKMWPDSRFLIMDVSFKNVDKESRLPVAGSAIILHGSSELEYDSLESIPIDGYGIWFKSINPLLTMRTKLVYRIPKDIDGSIYWRPGRNTDGIKLWCSYLSQS